MYQFTNGYHCHSEQSEESHCYTVRLVHRQIKTIWKISKHQQ